MRNFFLAIVGIWTVMSCSLDEENFSSNPNLTLLFSTDTVAFDTLLSATRSSTRRLKVINPNNESINLNSISLGKGDDSDYSVIINGRTASGVSNQTLLGGDSLLVLIEVNVTPRDENLPYIVKDSIVFEWNTNRAHVKLIAYGQDGNRRTKGIICDETWTSDRPHIIADTLLVSPDCELTIEKGAKIYFENDAALFFQGTLKAIGDSANHIEFRNARFDGVYNQVPGQWNGIYFLEGSSNNEISYADIYNGQFGLRIGTPDEDNEPDVVVSNTKIYNMSFAGILAFTSDVKAINTLIYNCGTYLVGNFAGGNYTYQHCTFSNDPSLFIQDEPSVQFSDNILIGENELLTDDLSLLMQNTIVWGTGEEEFQINTGGGSAIEVTLSTNIIKSALEFENNFTSLDFNFAGFRDPFLFDYSLDSLAFAQDKGTPLDINDDITGTPRDAMPDIGAYERIDK